VCNRDCPDACAILATVQDGRVTALKGDPSHPVTAGALCPRTSRFLERQYSPDRLTKPLVRASTGEPFREIGWDEALDLAADRLVRIRAESGPAAILHYRSGGSLGMLMCLTDLFFERFGPVTVKRGDVCSGAGEAAQEADFGLCDSSDVFDLRHAREIVLWGRNLRTCSPHLLRIVDSARGRGAGALLIDPVRHATAAHADRLVQPRPGGDFDFAMAAARLLLETGGVDPDAASWCDGLDAFRALALSRTVEAWCERAGVTTDEAEDLAGRLGRNRPATILLGWGLGRRLHGGATVRAIDALAAITGNVGVPGGGVSFYCRRRGAFDASFVTGASARTLCEPLLGREVLAAAGPPVRAAWVTAGNPVAMLPESRVVADALRTREFTVVVDAFLTDTARCAHLVLPTVTLIESDDLLGSYGHHWLSASRPVVPPPPGVRSDLEIAQGLAARTGLADALAGTARDWKRRMVEPRLGPAGVTLEMLEAGAVRNPLAPAVLFEGRRFPTPGGRARLVSAEPPAIARDPAFPLTLMALSTPRSQCSQWAWTPDSPAVATVHPDAAGGIADGEVARLESAIGSMDVRVRHDAGQRPDVALMSKGGPLHDGLASNAVVAAAVTDLGEGAALYDQGVRLARGGEP
jgi:anaerobic selenocysteine-containing dehydrogenase